MSFVSTPAPHGERCVCAQFNKQFKSGNAVLYGSHCQSCKTGGAYLTVIPVKSEERIEQGVGKLLYLQCTRCSDRQWSYRDNNLEHSDERNFCEDSIWRRN